MRFGILGVGTIGTAVAAGLCRERAASGITSIVLSPRGAARAQALASEHAQVTVAADNQGVLDDCDVVMVAVRPDVVAAVLGELRFRPDHRVLSLVASATQADLAPRVAPARSLARILPMPPCAKGRGSVLALGLEPDLVPCLAGLGSVLQVADEGQLAALIGLTGLTASFFGLLGETAGWAVAHGVSTETAERYLAAMVAGMCADRLDADSGHLIALAGEAETPGGLNAQCREQLDEVAAYAPFVEALDGLRDRLGLP